MADEFDVENYAAQSRIIAHLEAQLALSPCGKHRMCDWVSGHDWGGCQLGGSPVDATSTEWIRDCKTCGIEDTCEDPLPACSGYCRACRAEQAAVALALEKVVKHSPVLVGTVAPFRLGCSECGWTASSESWSAHIRALISQPAGEANSTSVAERGRK